MSDNSAGAKWTVKFMPDEITVNADDGANLLQVALDAGVHLDANCGGSGACGKCTVKVDGEIEKTEAQAKRAAKKAPEGLELACLTIVRGDLVVEIPAAQRLGGKLMLTKSNPGENTRLRSEIDIEQLLARHGTKSDVNKHLLRVPQATAENNISDLERVLGALKKESGIDGATVNFNALIDMPADLREKDGEVTVTVGAERSGYYCERDDSTCFWTPRIERVEAGDKLANHTYLAFDLGTTTIWGQLVDANTGKVIAASGEYNEQFRYGADVINRIIACGKKAEKIGEVQQAAVSTFNKVIAQLGEQSPEGLAGVSHMVAAGNTTMTHIFLGLDPRFIRMSPHTPVARFTRRIRASRIGLNLPPHVSLYMMPSVSGWVGGDIVAGVLASGIHEEEPLTLFADLGTNGEIVIGNKDFLVSASCSAGPAFEGGEIRHGSRAVPGAIEDFALGSPVSEPMVMTIGRQQATGICGSGLINSVSELYLTGVLDRTGKYDFNSGSPRLRRSEEGAEYVMVLAEHSGNGEDIVLDEMDLDNLIRAKAAVYAGIRTLMVNVGVEAAMLDRVILAGGFGSSIDIEKAIMIGLLPDLPREKYTFIGNSSLHGARMVARNRSLRESAEKVTDRMTYVDLGASTTFSDEYNAAQFLPHTNIDQFPTVAEILARLEK